MLRTLTVGLDVQILRNRRSRTAQRRFGSMGASKPMEARHGRAAYACGMDTQHGLTVQVRGMREQHGRTTCDYDMSGRHVLTNPTHCFHFLRTAILRDSGRLSTGPFKTGHVGTRDVGHSPTTTLIRACPEILHLLPSKHEEPRPSKQNHRGSHHGTQMRVFPR